MGAAAGPERAGAAGTDWERALRERGQPGRTGVSRWGAGVTRELSPGARAATRPGKARERELQSADPLPHPPSCFSPVLAAERLSPALPVLSYWLGRTRVPPSRGPPLAHGFPLDGQAGRPISARISASLPSSPSSSFAGARFPCEKGSDFASVCGAPTLWDFLGEVSLFSPSRGVVKVPLEEVPL